MIPLPPPELINLLADLEAKRHNQVMVAEAFQRKMFYGWYPENEDQLIGDTIFNPDLSSSASFSIPPDETIV